MKAAKILLINILLMISLVSFSQLRFDYPIKDLDSVRYIVRYSMAYQQDSLNDSHIRKEEMLLFLGDSISKYCTNNYFVFDTIMRSIHNIEQFREYTSKPMKQGTAFQYDIYKLFLKDSISFYTYLMPDRFMYKEPLGLFPWELTEVSDSIHGYYVQKATCHFSGRDWIAWFSPEISYSDGPYKFNGLPGLILELSDTRGHYEFSFISIMKPPKPMAIDRRVKPLMEVSKNKCMKAEDNYRESVSRYAEQNGMSKESVNSIKRNLKIKNNPIELDRE